LTHIDTISHMVVKSLAGGSPEYYFTREEFAVLALSVDRAHKNFSRLTRVRLQIKPDLEIGVDNIIRRAGLTITTNPKNN
jgi:hypothetical protein